MAVNGTPLRQKFLIRGVVRHVLQDANDVNLVNGARMGSRDDFQLERLWPSHHLSLRSDEAPCELSYGILWLYAFEILLGAPVLPWTTMWHRTSADFWGLPCLVQTHRSFPRFPKSTWLQENLNMFLVGGIPTPLKNMSLSVGMMKFPIDGKIIHSCSKPPTSISIGFLEIILHVLPSFSEIRGWTWVRSRF